MTTKTERTAALNSAERKTREALQLLRSARRDVRAAGFVGKPLDDAAFHTVAKVRAMAGALEDANRHALRCDARQGGDTYPCTCDQETR